MATSSPLRRRAVALGVLVWSLACLLLLPPTEKPEQPDETAWIAVGAESFARLASGDSSRRAWSDPRWGPFGYPYPVLGKLAIGASVALHGRCAEAHALLPSSGFDWEAIRRTRPSPGLLRAGRQPMLLFGALASLLLFLLVSELTASTPVGILTAALFVTRPLVLESARQAMVDMPAVTFGLLTLLFAARATTERALSPVVLAGLACGLAAACKLSGALVAVIAVAWWAARSDRPPLALSLLLFLATASLGFVLVQPPAWSGPLDHLAAIVEHARQVGRYHVPPERHLVSWSARAARVATMGLATSDPLRAWLGWSGAGAALAALGALGSWRRPWAPALAIWLSTAALALVLTVPFDWRRWFLPLEPCWAFLQALGLWTLAVGRNGWAGIRVPRGPYMTA